MEMLTISPYINTREDTDSTNTTALGSAGGSITELPCRHSGRRR